MAKMLPLLKRGARRVLGPRLTGALKHALGYPQPAPPSAPPPPLPAVEELPPPPPPADPPKKLLFLSDCYARDVVWGAFHKTMQAYCAAAFERVLAVRTNALFHDFSHHPRPHSAEHLARVRRAVHEFAPDLIFSVNRGGLCEPLLAGVHPAVKAITVFVDYYDRMDDSMHRYGPRDLVWGMGGRKREAEYLRKFSARLRPEQAIHTLWGADHNLFRPHEGERDTGVVFVGTLFGLEGFVSLVETVGGDEHNRRVLLETYEAHREEFIDDWPAALRRRGFAFDRLPPDAAFQFENAHLQAAVCDQISLQNRINCLAALAGLDVKIYSYGNREWIRAFGLVNAAMLKHYQFRPVSDPADLVALYGSSRIGIDIQHAHTSGRGLSFRVFDLMACKTLLAAHADSKGVLDELGFVEGQDYVCFRGPADLREKCEYYLAHEPERRAIAESGYEKVRSRHTLAHRFAEVFSRFGFRSQAACYERLCRGDIRTLLDAEAILKEKVTTLEPHHPPAGWWGPG